MMYHKVPIRWGRPAALGFLFWALCSLSLPLFAQESASGRGDYLTLKVAVMGPGDELYFWWGHIALIIDDAMSGQSRFYDYGLFSFENDNFFTNFALGRLLYSCGVSPMERNLMVYQATNRDITIYTLDLPASIKEKIWLFVENNVRPENRNYFYHHFKDNCSTRIRDILDYGLDGQFKARFGTAPGRFTLRQHVRRHTWFSPFSDWILNFWMGQDIDTPITVWEEMFLPQEVGNRIEDFYYTDPYYGGPGDADQPGSQRKLVSSVEVLNRAVNRPAVLDAPRRQWPRELVVGLGIGALLWLFYGIRRKWERPGRVLLGVSQSLLGLFFGGVGSILLFMTFFTDHDYTYHNSNLLYINPLLLAAVPLGILMARGKRPEVRKGRKKRKPPRSGQGSVPVLRVERLLGFLWIYVFLAGVLTMAIKALPWFYQQNQVTQALVLPFALTLGILPLIARRVGH